MRLNSFAREDGHTLVETLVAMALFTGVVIPLGGILGNLTLDKSHIELQQALQYAEIEMDRITVSREFGRKTSREGDFLIEAVPLTGGNLVGMTVFVHPTRSPDKTLVQLTKWFLSH